VRGSAFPEGISVDLEVLTPLLGNRALFKDGTHRTGWFSRATIDTLIWINVELAVLVVVVFAVRWMNAIDWADIHTRAVFHTNTWFCNHIGHWFSLLSGTRSPRWNLLRHE
jgi:hypothetical protein